MHVLCFYGACKSETNGQAKLTERKDFDPKVDGAIPQSVTVFLPTTPACCFYTLKIHNESG